MTDLDSALLSESAPRWRWRPPVERWRPKLRWFAAEFLVVVTGVLVALALNAWWGSRQDAAAEARYLALLSRDLQATLDQLTSAEAFEDRQLRDGAAAYRALSGPGLPADPQATADALGKLGVRRTLVLDDGAYQDLLATGNLRVIRNAALRERIVGFYESAGATFQRANLNTQMYVDEGFARNVVLSGLITPRVTQQGIPVVVGAEAELDSALAGGFRDGPSRLWSLPPDGPEWAVVRNNLLLRLRIAAIARRLIRSVRDDVRDLQHAVDAERARRGDVALIQP